MAICASDIEKNKVRGNLEITCDVDVLRLIDDAVCAAARQEIIRRYYDGLCERRQGRCGDETVYKLELLMQQAKVDASLRPVVAASLAAAEETGNPAAIELPDGQVITGKTTDLMGASSATLLNALKALTGISHEKHLISREAIAPIQTVKVQDLGSANPPAPQRRDPHRPDPSPALRPAGVLGPHLGDPLPCRRRDLQETGPPAHLRAPVRD